MPNLGGDIFYPLLYIYFFPIDYQRLIYVFYHNIGLLVVREFWARYCGLTNFIRDPIRTPQFYFPFMGV
ncbi:hypothetical protein BBD46_04015 [Natrialba sp. SSL1]|nr:hypothetical protein BBD46_04015 [Natrialba sp. SSL1]